MKLAVISMIRDEADIIGPFLRHLGALFDIAILLDQRSSDGTGAVMRAACEGRPGWSHYFCDFAGRHQKEVNRIFMADVFARGADAVFLIDADEFIAVASRDELLSAAAEMNDKEAIGTFHWRACVPMTFDNWTFNPAIPVWVATQNATMSKIAIPRSLYARCPELTVSQGNHNVLFPAGIADPHRLQLGHLFHIPIRSREQLVLKAFVASLANLAKHNPMADEGFHKRQLLEIIDQGDLSEDVLASLAGRYSEMRQFECWARLLEMARHGFMLRTLDVPMADLSLPTLAKPDINRLVARGIREFDLENIDGGGGALEVAGGVVRFRLRV